MPTTAYPLALKNIRLFEELGKAGRVAAILALNTYQLYQWHYRMSRPGAWLYRRTLPYAKYRYASEWMASTSFASP